MFRKLVEMLTGAKRNGIEQAFDGEKYSVAYEAYQRGSVLLLAQKYAEALPLFDVAAEAGIDETYQYRGIYLQQLDFHIDAIDDFTLSISLGHLDCNDFFCRATSYATVGNKTQASADIAQAVTLSKIKNDLNASYDSHAKSKGYSSMTHMLESERQGIIAVADFFSRFGPKPEKLLRRHK